MTIESRPLVVYVDDEHANRLVFEASLRGKFRIETFADGADALRRVREGDVAVLVTDQRMPGLSGNELLERAREISPDTERVVITAYDDAGPILEALNTGLASRYLLKPWARAELEAAIESCLRVHRLREQKLDLENRLFQAERFVTLGAIAAGIFHDMSQPILVLGSTVEAPGGDASAQEDMRAAVKQLAGLIRGAKSFLAHPETAISSPAANAADGDLAEAARSAVALCRARIRHDGGELVVDTEPGLPRTRLATTSAIQVFVNLLVNATQAQRGAGRIALEVKRQGDGVLAVVRDQGPGMPPDVLARVREPFFTTKPAGEGTGLGLFTCQRLVDQVGGTLEIESVVGRGTTISVWLPAAAH